jgi:UDP-N-acetylglucosamine:LPS N-acetylglucosamine transferase
MLEEIVANPGELGRRASAARSLGKPDATARLADLVDRIARKEAA